MGTTNSVLVAAAIYRDTPNTFGHDDVSLRELKRLIGLVASQRMLIDSIKDAREQLYCDASPGMKHLWDRLVDVESSIKELENKYGQAVKSVEYFNNRWGQSMPLLQVEAS
ncbi:hypothetical protein DNAM_470 [Pseudomonas phage BroderSalsa]|nr:hypothetical protein DNAM_470 [Pseudomonas phage BroderSalsa]